MTYDVSIFQSSELIGYCQDNDLDSFKAAKNVKKALEEVASNQAFPVDVNVRTYHNIDPPREAITDDFGNRHVVGTPCDREYPTQYANLNRWWEDRIECLFLKSDDSNLLLTNTDREGGGIGSTGGNVCFSQTGQGCANVNLPSSFSEHNFQSSVGNYDALQTAIHEIGHNLIDHISNDGEECADTCGEDPDEDDPEPDGAVHHRMGSAVEYGSFGNHAYTPMSSGSSYIECTRYKAQYWGPCSGSRNYCYYMVPSESEIGASEHGLRFSDCVVHGSDSVDWDGLAVTL